MRMKFRKMEIVLGRKWNVLEPCVSAPMIQINDDYYEDLDENTIEILNSLIKDKPVKPGSFRGRKNTSPEKNNQTF